MFKKTKLSTAVQAAIVLSAATLMHGCGLEGSDSGDVGPVKQVINAPKGTVVGTVTDTNGNFIVGAAVYLGSKKTTTNAGGQYTFTGVAATNTVNLGDDTQQQALEISIVPPAGYLGATVTVTPEAQIDGNGESVENGGDETANQVTTFISGYTAQAGTAVLPALQSTVSGTLRSSITGERIPDHSVSLDMESVSGVQQQQTQNGVRTSYATVPFSTTADADGNFTITGVPDDSVLRFVVGGYTVDSVTANATGIKVVTTDEVEEIVVSDVMITPIPSNDNIDPYVIGVSNIAHDNMFDKGIDGTNGITVYFSEVITPAPNDDYEVVVVDDTNSQVIQLVGAPTLAADGKSLSFTTASALPAGADIHINIVRADVQDTSANMLNDGVSGTDPDAVDYDFLVSATTETKYLRLVLRTWEDANIGALAVTNELQEKSDGYGVDDLPEVQTLNDAYSDVWDDGSISAFDIHQLNSADNDDGLLGNDAAERLGAIASAIAGHAVTVNANTAQVTFTPSNGSYYEVDVTRGTSSILASVTVDFISGNTEWGTGNSFTVDGPDLMGNDTVAMVVGNVQPGDVVTITPYDDLAYAGTPKDITLVDNVPPTTVLQNSYGLSSHESGVDSTYGNGGELSQIGTLTLNGTPYLNVTMGTLDNIVNADNNLDDELIAYNTVDPNTGLPYIDSAATPNVYDAQAYTSFAGMLGRTIGVSFSEDTVLTGTPVVSTGTSALSNWAVLNDVILNDEGTTVNSDLINFDVNDVLVLANSDHNREIDFSGVVTDSAGNVATNAKVTVRDVMPPMVESAVYSGSVLTVRFNEVIDPQVGDELYLYDAAGIVQKTITLGVGTINDFLAQTNKKVLNIRSDDWGDDLTWTAVFDLTAYPEGGSAVDKTHSVLNAWNIADLQGNTMADENAGVTPVRFAVYNDLDAMNVVSENYTNFTAGSTSFTVVIRTNHAIELGNNLSIPDGATSLNGSQVREMFVFQDNGGVTLEGNIDDANTNAVLSPDGKTLTVNVALTVAIASTDRWASVSLTSDYDDSQTTTINGNTAP